MWQLLLKELAVFSLRQLVKYVENEINEDTVKDVEKRVGKTAK